MSNNTIIIDPCPFCKGSAKISWKDIVFGGQNDDGQKKLKYRFQVICNKCHSRGKPIISDWLIDCNPWASSYTGRNYGENRYGAKQDEMIREYVELAISAWNNRGNAE